MGVDYPLDFSEYVDALQSGGDFASHGYEVVTNVFANGAWNNFVSDFPCNFIYFLPEDRQAHAAWSVRLQFNGPLVGGQSLQWTETVTPIIPIGFPMNDLKGQGSGGAYTLIMVLYQIPQPAIELMHARINSGIR